MIRPDELANDHPLRWSPGTGRDVWDLLCASFSGDLEGAQRLIAKNPALVHCQYAYRTPLYFAVRENHLEVAEFLLQQGADPLNLAVNDTLLEICHDRGYDAMQALLAAHMEQVCNASLRGEPAAEAIRRHDLDTLRRLLDSAPELLHVGDMRSNQPIHWGAMTRQIDVLDELCARGANLHAVRSDGARPMQLANGDYHFRGWRDVPRDWPVTPAQIISHLRALGAECDLCTACHIGDLDRAQSLIEADPSLANRLSDYVSYYPGGGSPLTNAAGAGHRALVELLLKHGADPNLREEGIAPHGHALYSAAANGHIEIARILLEHGAFPNPEVESSADALSRAISNDNQPMIDLLASYGAARGVHLLAYDGDVQTAAAVFAANPALANNGEALANAAGEGHESFVRLMLRYQPDLPKRTTFPGWLPGAATRELTELLFEHGYSPSQLDWLHATPLHQFARKGNVEMAAFYIDHGAELHARDDDLSSTPLGWAAKFGQKEMVELLLERGTHPNLVDDPPWGTPLAWAIRRGYVEIAEILKSHGAR